ncbi:hypothetical protein ACQ4XT_18145 [Halobacillus faecis]
MIGNLPKYWVSFVIILGYLTQFLLSQYTLIKVNVDEDILRNIINIAIGSLSSILGILVSVLILSITIAGKTISEQMKNTILEYKILSYYFQVSISTLLIMITANFLLNDTVTNLAVNVTLFGSFTFILSILILVPTIKKTIIKASSRESVMGVLKRMNEGEAQVYLKSEYDQNNSFYSISIIGVNLIKNQDRIGFVEILNHFQKVLSNRIKDINPNIANQIRDLINSYVKIQYVFLKDVDSENKEWVLHEMINTYIKLKKRAVEQNLPYFDFLEYDDFIQECLIKALHFDIELSKESLKVYQKIYESNLDYFVPSEVSTRFGSLNDNCEFEANKEFDQLLHSQWTYISSTLLYNFKKVINKIDFNAENLIVSCVLDYNRMIEKTLKSDNLSENQRVRLIQALSNELIDFITTSMKENTVYEPNISFFYFHGDLNGEKKSAYYWHISFMIDLLMPVTKYNRLNSGILNDFGTVGRSLAKELLIDEEAKIIIFKLFKTFSNVAKVIEPNATIKAYKNYIEIYEQMESIILWIKKDVDKAPENILDELNEILKELNQLEDFKNILNSEESFLKQYLLEE